LLIGVSLFLRFVRGNGNGSHVGDDRFDLRWLEVILERGIRSVPLTMKARITSSFPPAAALFSAGP